MSSTEEAEGDALCSSLILVRCKQKCAFLSSSCKGHCNNYSHWGCMKQLRHLLMWTDLTIPGVPFVSRYMPYWILHRHPLLISPLTFQMCPPYVSGSQSSAGAASQALQTCSHMPFSPFFSCTGPSAWQTFPASEHTATACKHIHLFL